MKLLYLGAVHAAWVPDTPFGFESQEGFCKARKEELILLIFTIFPNYSKIKLFLSCGGHERTLVDSKYSQFPLHKQVLPI